MEEMTREDIMEMLGYWFELEPEEDGSFDIDSYDFQSGCYMGHKWFCLAEVVRCIEANI